jgi:TrmH family RNA methyltransferase
MTTITSPQNPKIKELIKLKKASKRKEEDLIIIDGKAEIKMAVEAGVQIKEAFYCPDFAKAKNIFKFSDEIINEVPAEIFKKISFRENPDGWLVVAKPKRKKIADIKLSKNPLVIVLETVEKPGNLGAILRSADAANADAVILCDPRTDIYNPNVIRASLGTVFTKQVVVSNNQETLNWLKENKITSLAASVQSDNFYFNTNLKKSIAIVVGTEHEGLSEFWQKNADERIKIPMLGKIDSLNASVSAAVILFEAVRQRNKIN